MILLLHMMRPLELVGKSMQEEVTLGKERVLAKALAIDYLHLCCIQQTVIRN